MEKPEKLSLAISSSRAAVMMRVRVYSVADWR